jgi:creatinine amidohydrolase
MCLALGRCVLDTIVRLLRSTGETGRPLRWARLSRAGVEALQDGGMDLAILPCGAIEQHGPHLPIETDVAIAEAVSLWASALTGVPVLPTVAYANSLGHTDRWPGTLSLSPVTLIQTVREIGAWFVRGGGRRLLILNAHFGNDAPLRCAIDHLRTEYEGRLLVGLCNTWTLSARAKEAYLLDGTDIHANRAETSLMLAIDPGGVAGAEGADDPDRTDGLVFTHPVSRTSRNGVTGRPSEATALEGETQLRALGEDFAAIVGKARVEIPPI